MIYQKPSMEKVELRANRGVADACWANANHAESKRDTYYYEFPNNSWAGGLGTGTWVAFKAGSGNDCASANGFEHLVVEYGPTIKGNETLETQADADLKAVLDGMGAWDNGGSPFKGTGFASSVGKSW